jgi:predicted Zn-dependent peptidase
MTTFSHWYNYLEGWIKKIENIVIFPQITIQNTFTRVLSDMHYELKKIAGIDVLFAPMQDSTSTTVEILVKAGSVYESKETNGLSHFLEHMFFKWGKKYTSPKVVVETIDELGGEFNAFTGNDYAGYYVKSAPEHVYTALDVLSDMMVHSTFPKDELEKEKWVVIQEIKMYDDRPDAKVMQYWDKNYFGDNSYGRPVIGPESNVLSFTQDHLFEHKEQLYTKDNMLIVIAWKLLDQARLEDTINTLFASLPEKTTGKVPPYSPVHPSNTRDIVSQGTNQNHLVFGWPGFAHDDPKNYAGKMLANIVGGTMSSRLFQEIREKRWLCYYIWCSHWAEPTHGTFMIRAGLSKENYISGVEALKRELTAISQGNITQDELTKAQWNMLGKIQMGIETSDEMADFIGAQQLLYGKINTLEEILEKYKAVTLVDVHAVATYLNPEKLYGCTID